MGVTLVPGVDVRGIFVSVAGIGGALPQEESKKHKMSSNAENRRDTFILIPYQK
jgi:hypothetical protein